MILFTAGIGPYFYIVGTDVHRSVDWDSAKQHVQKYS